jgi:hypothetical protein
VHLGLGPLRLTADARGLSWVGEGRVVSVNRLDGVR